MGGRGPGCGAGQREWAGWAGTRGVVFGAGLRSVVYPCRRSCFQPGPCALGTAGGTALRPLRGGLRPAWAPAAAQRRVRLPEAEEKRTVGIVAGRGHAVP